MANQYYIAFTIQSSQVPGDLTDFPVYLDLSQITDTAFWNRLSATGGELRCFKADGTTELPREIVAVDTGAQTGEVHVKYTGTLSSTSNTVIRLYYGDTTLNDYAPTDPHGRNAVWSNGYAGVWHLQEEAAGTGNADLYTNSVGNGYHGTDNISATGQQGQVGAGQEFDGSDDEISLTNLAPALEGASGITVAGWVNINSVSARNLLVKSHIDGGSWGLGFLTEDTGELYLYGRSQPSDSEQSLYGNTVLSTDTWHHIAGVNDFSNDAMEVFLNGASDGASSAIFGASSYSIGSGQSGDYLGDQYWFNGLMDEVRIYTRPVSADEISATHANQSDPATFYTVSSTQEDTAAFPTIQDRLTYQFSSATTSHTVSLPEVVDAGDLLLVLFSSVAKDNQQNTPAGWTQLSSDYLYNGRTRVGMYAMVAEGTEGGTTVDLTTDTTTTAVAIVVRISGWGGSLTDSVDIATTAYNTSTSSPDPPSVTAEWGADKNLFLAFAAACNDSIDFTDAPTGYGNLTYVVSASGTDNSTEAAIADRTTISASDDPDSFTLASSETWVAGTVVVEGVHIAQSTPAGIAHTHTVASPTIWLTYLATPAQSSHAHTLESPAIQQTYLRTPGEIASSHALASPTIQQTYISTPADLIFAQTLASPGIQQQHVITPEALTHTQALASPETALTYRVTPAEILQDQTLASPGITQTHISSPAEVLHGQSLEAPGYTVTISAVPETLFHGQTVTSPAIIQVHRTAPVDIGHTHTLASAGTGTAIIADPEALLHTHTVAAPGVVLTYIVTPAECTHAHALALPGVTQRHQATPGQLFHTYQLAQPAIIQQHQGLPAELFHTHHVATTTPRYGVLCVDTVTVVPALTATPVLYPALQGAVQIKPYNT